MSTIVVELTNHCNLRCHHCFDNRHSADGNLKLEIIEKILSGAKDQGFDNISFTGGEPTLHPGFIEILRMICDAGYNFGFVTNGWNFTDIYEKLLPHRSSLTGITFSLDGAEEATHDRIRGEGSYRRVIKAISICVVKDISFTINTVISSNNICELSQIAELAMILGSRGLRFGHLMSSPQTLAKSLDLLPEKKREVDAAILRLQKTFTMPIVMAPGHYTTDLFPCAPLQMQEFNIDWRGNVTFCCHLSGHGKGTGNGDVVGNLDKIGFSEAYELLVNLNKAFRKEKSACKDNDKFEDSDYFPCLYCLNYFNKVD